MADKTWSAAGNSSASVDASWSGGTKPIAGDNLIFDATSVTNCIMDEAVTYGNITLAAGYSGVVTQGAVDFGYVDFSQAAGTWTGVVTKTQTCSGAFVRTGGTITDHVLRLKMTGTDKNLSASGNLYLLWVASGKTNDMSSSLICADGLRVDSGAILNINAGVTLTHNTWDTFSFLNDGIIQGAGNFLFHFHTTSRTITLGVINCVGLSFQEHVAAGASRTATLGANAVLGATVTVLSAHAANTMTLDLAGYQLSATTITASTRGIISDSVGGSVTTGNVIINGTGAVLTQTSTKAITITGNLTNTAGTITQLGTITLNGNYLQDGAGATLTGSVSYSFICSGDFVVTAGTLTDYVLCLKMTGANKALTTSTWFKILDIAGAGTTTLTGNSGVDANPTQGVFYVRAGAVFVILTSQTFTFPFTNRSPIYSNAGRILTVGIGEMRFLLYQSASASLGLIDGPAVVFIPNGAASSTLTMSGSGSGGALTISSNDAANTATLDLAGYSLTASTISVSTRGIISSSVAGARIDTGDLTVSANGTLTEANITQIKSSGNVDLSAGTYTPSAARWIMTGLAKTLKLAAGHKLYDLITTGTSDIRLSANATVSNELVMSSRINPLTYTLTHESPDKLFDQRRLHYSVLHEPVQREQGRADMILNYLTGRQG